MVERKGDDFKERKWLEEGRCLEGGERRGNALTEGR
jgi:hypothetical protein